MLLPFSFGRLDGLGGSDLVDRGLAWRQLRGCHHGAWQLVLGRQQMGYVEVEQCRLQPRGLLQRRRLSAQDLLFMLLEEFQDIGGTAQQDWVVEEMSAAEVAVVAEESPHKAAVMVMVNARGAGERLPADEAEPVLPREHAVEVFQRQSVVP
jgi:hypothetical protein